MSEHAVWVAISDGPEGAFALGYSSDRDRAVSAAVAEVGAYFGTTEGDGGEADDARRALTDPQGDGSWTDGTGELTVRVESAAPIPAI